jgi:hypothetical protein
MNLTRLTSIAAAAALGLAATAASAQGGYGSLSAFDWEVGQGDAKVESTGVRAVGGYMFNPGIGLEVHAAAGGTDELQYGSQDAEAELNKLLAIFAKPTLPLPVPLVEANVFGLVGYSYGKVDILAETTTDVVSQNSFSWGFGAELGLIPNRLYLTADHIDYISRTGVDASATSIGLRLSFSGQ